MNDISKCSNHEGCTVKETCRRFISHCSEYQQSYYKFEPTKGKECFGYYPPMSIKEINER